ncbi:hypothetical protein HYU07_02365 [Candidatus Woesearchaeota archaeon]|nr:hypothetical protein [Candidatus Woesearchaeota archaeon]
MEKTINYSILGLLFVLAVLAGCAKSQTASPVTGHSTETASSGNLRHLVLEIKGMYCASCGPGVAKMISEIDGVVVSRVSNADDKGEFIYDANKVSKEHIVSMLKDTYSGKVLLDMPAPEEMINTVKALKNN